MHSAPHCEDLFFENMKSNMNVSGEELTKVSRNAQHISWSEMASICFTTAGGDSGTSKHLDVVHGWIRQKRSRGLLDAATRQKRPRRLAQRARISGRIERWRCCGYEEVWRRWQALGSNQHAAARAVGLCVGSSDRHPTRPEQRGNHSLGQRDWQAHASQGE